MACKYKSRVWDNGWCKVACMYCTLTQEMNCKYNKKTNADRIRAMTDEDLADFLAYTWATSARAWQKDTGETLHWLKQSAEGE